MAMHWVWKAIAAGLCGAAAHTLLMLLRSWSGLLPSFQPYESLQNTISHFIGTDIHPIVPWMLSFVSGATIIGFLFGLTYKLLPGKTAAIPIPPGEMLPDLPATGVHGFDDVAVVRGARIIDGWGISPGRDPSSARWAASAFMVDDSFLRS